MGIILMCSECGNSFILGSRSMPRHPGDPCDDCKRKSKTYVVPADAPMVPGRKLRDALLMAGATPGMTIKNNPDAANTGPAIDTQEMKRRSVEFWADMDGAPMAADPVPRPSFIRLIGSTAWRLFVVMVVVGVTVVVLAGVRT